MNEKKRKTIGIVLIAIIVVCVIGIFATPSKDDEENVATTTPAATEEQKNDASETEQEVAAETEPETKISTLDEMSVIFSDSVRNDTTGRWRMAKVTGSKSAEEYAVDYYKEYFDADDEVHAVVNFTLNTTACITNVGGKINVRIYEYVDGEEHDAKALFGGEKLAEYNIDPDTGEAENVE